MMFEAPLPLEATDDAKNVRYQHVLQHIKACLQEPQDPSIDWVAALATVACELHHAFDYYHWTGFYRTISPNMLAIGPYQGTHGCILIPFSKGVCGAAARTATTQCVPDVHKFPGHIACASTTNSEIVVPVLNQVGQVVAVLDVDSNHVSAFSPHVDQPHLEALCRWLGRQFDPVLI